MIEHVDVDVAPRQMYSEEEPFKRLRSPWRYQGTREARGSARRSRGARRVASAKVSEATRHSMDDGMKPSSLFSRRTTREWGGKEVLHAQ